MKNNKYSRLLLLVFLSICMLRCGKEVTEFGFNGSIKGTITDDASTPICSDLNSNNLIVRLLGSGDKLTTDIRVKGDGTYQNTALYPKLHKVWLEGPIIRPDTISIDFSTEFIHIKDFKVIPLISPKIINSTVNGTTININYSIVGNAGNTVKSKVIYCSTVPYPTASIGSSANVYFTKTVTLPTALNGTVTITDPLIVAGTKYYIRIGALANIGVLMNYSNQIEVVIP